VAQRLYNPALWFRWRSEIRVSRPGRIPGTIEAGGKEAIDGPAIFPTAWFSGRNRAIEWLKSP
jgi:hypothetical protein